MHTSFLIPVYDTDAAVLRLCINSALKTAGDQHEVVVVNDGSNRTETIDFLNRCEASGLENLKIVTNSENSGVSYSLNKAAAVATGDLYAPVDHDDMVVLSGFAVMWTFQIYYGGTWAYSDELQINYKGIPIGPMYKPEYSPQLLRSVMYINHLQLIPNTLFESVGGYREGFEGSQDHDLALRMSEHTKPHHVRAIAYLWRRGTTTLSVEDGRIGDLSIDASRRALEGHFERRGLVADVRPYSLAPEPGKEPQATGTFVSRIIPSTMPKISIVIPCKLGSVAVVGTVNITVLEHCLLSIRESFRDDEKLASNQPELEIVLVLNHEDDQEHASSLISAFDLSGFALSDEPGFSFSRKCNLGAKHASGEIIVFLNDDTAFESKEWTSHVVSLLEEEDVACVGGLLLNNDRTVQSCGDNIGRNSAVHYAPNPSAATVGDAMHRYIADHETTAITGAFFCCRKQTFEDLGGFSLAFPNSFQDVDFCLRARQKQMRCLVSPHIRLLHFESVSRNPAVDDQTLNLIRQIHASTMGPTDPFALWAYEIPRPRILSRPGIRHYLEIVKGTVWRIAFIGLIHMTPGPSHPRHVLSRNEWRVR
jgi:GT2 family glycosyltransferase